MYPFIARYSNDANYDNLKILMKPNPSAATKCQTLQYEIDMKQITQKIEHLKTASKALKTVNRNDMVLIMPI